MQDTELKDTSWIKFQDLNIFKSWKEKELVMSLKEDPLCCL